MYSGTSFRRFNLTIREIYFTGVLSLIIILISGLFVGMVLGLQGYDTLQRYGARQRHSVLVHCRWLRGAGSGDCRPAVRQSRRLGDDR